MLIAMFDLRYRRWLHYLTNSLSAIYALRHDISAYEHPLQALMGTLYLSLL